jgi:hypothetical protein
MDLVVGKRHVADIHAEVHEVIAQRRRWLGTPTDRFPV